MPALATAPPRARKPAPRPAPSPIPQPPPRAPRAAHAPHAPLEQIIDAAEEVILRHGMGRLTLDLVARQAGLSKAGLLHHVPGKDALVRAMVLRHANTWRDELLARYEAQRAAGDPHPTLSAMLGCCLSGPHAWTEAERARSRILVAALVHNESLVEPFRDVNRRVGALLRRDALPPGAAELIQLAVHGLWFEWIFGMGDVTPARLRAVRCALLSLRAPDRAASDRAASSPSSGAQRRAGKRGRS